MKHFEIGLINDDFMHDRITGKLYLNEEDAYYPVKIYSDGRIVGFIDDRFRDGEYKEVELDQELIDKIKTFI